VELGCAIPLRATQAGDVADDIVTVLMAKDLGLDRFQNKPVILRLLSEISCRMRVAKSGSQHEGLLFAASTDFSFCLAMMANVGTGAPLRNTLPTPRSATSAPVQVFGCRIDGVSAS
jgi:hypothetical protein